MLSQGGLAALVPAAPECLVNFPLGVMKLRQAASNKMLTNGEFKNKIVELRES